MESIREHLKQLSAVSVTVAKATFALEQTLCRYGPVSRSSFTSFTDGLKFLIPLKSFTTRFLLLGLDEWTIILTDMKGENPYVDAYAISRATNCSAIGVVLQEQRRELQIVERGKKVRQVQSLLDFDTWYYREEGGRLPWEDPDEYTRKSKRKRLTVEALKRYFATYTGFKVPSWNTARFSEIFGLERSVHEAQVPIVHYDTEWDL